MKRHNLWLAAVVTLFLCGIAGGDVITFDDVGLVHGEIVTTQIPGLTISAINLSGPDIAAVFDTGVTGSRDDDLEGPPWSGGNLPGLDSLELGNVLFIAENDIDVDEDDVLDFPDDEGGRPAGDLIFKLSSTRSSFGFDLIDVEGVGIGDEPGQFATFFMGGAPVSTILFEDFLLGGAHDQGAIFGNNTVNRIAPINVGPYDEIVVRLGGSGALDNLVLLPAPGALALMGLGLGLLSLSRRRAR